MEIALGLPLLIGLIGVALLFDFLNGLHDAANSIATIVSTRVLRPQYAVAWAAFFNFIAFLFFGLNVAQTLGTGIIDATIVDPRVIFEPMVRTIRQPPKRVPRPIAAWQARTTHSGTWKWSPR